MIAHDGLNLNGDVRLTQKHDCEALEIELLLQGIYHRYGFDYREYQRDPLKAKVRALLATHNVPSISALQDRILHDSGVMDAVLVELTGRKGLLFEDPEYVKQMRQTAIPWLRSHPSPKIWIANCVSAEEVCSVAILLEEEGIYAKSAIFATGANENLLRAASSGGIDRDRFDQGAANHLLSGGTATLSRYFEQDGDRLILLPHLRANITWAQFNLQTDASFNEFQLIVCRKVLGDFGAALQHRTLRLFHESLSMFGMLGVDNSAEIEPAPFCNWFKDVSAHGNLYKRVA